MGFGLCLRAYIQFKKSKWSLNWAISVRRLSIEPDAVCDDDFTCSYDDDDAISTLVKIV